MSLQDYNYIAQSMVNEDRSASVNTNTRVADAINDGDIVGAKNMVNKRLYEMAADRLKADSILRESMYAMGDEDEERRRLAALNMSVHGEFEDDDDDDDDEMEMEGLYASRMQRRRRAVNAAHKPGHWGESMHGGMRKRRKMGETRGGRFREQTRRMSLGVPDPRDDRQGLYGPGGIDKIYPTVRPQDPILQVPDADSGFYNLNASAHPGAMRKRRGMAERRGGGGMGGGGHKLSRARVNAAHKPGHYGEDMHPMKKRRDMAERRGGGGMGGGGHKLTHAASRRVNAAHQPGHWGEAMHKRHLNAAAGGHGGAGGGNGNRFSMRRATR
jgi:hypothetical protein